MPIVLTKSKIAPTETERGAQELLNELLKLFFSGTPHTSPITGQPVTFPVCDLFFNQTQLPKELSGNGKAQIHVVFVDLRPKEDDWTTAKRLVTVMTSLLIFVRVPVVGGLANEDDFQCRDVADNLKEILQSQDRYALAQKGIRYPRILRGPTPMPTTGFQVRMLTATCQLRYFVNR